MGTKVYSLYQKAGVECPKETGEMDKYESCTKCRYYAKCFGALATAFSSRKEVVETRFTCAICGKALTVREDKLEEVEDALDKIIRAPETNIAVVICRACYNKPRPL